MCFNMFIITLIKAQPYLGKLQESLTINECSIAGGSLGARNYEVLFRALTWVLHFDRHSSGNVPELVGCNEVTIELGFT